MGLDRERQVEREILALERGDWDAYFAAATWGCSAAYRERVERSNDPTICAIQLRSEVLRARGFVMPGVPTLAYWGDQERFHDDNVERAEMLPIEYGVVSGDRGEAFDLVRPVMTVVRPFLESTVRV